MVDSHSQKLLDGVTWLHMSSLRLLICRRAVFELPTARLGILPTSCVGSMLGSNLPSSEMTICLPFSPVTIRVLPHEKSSMCQKEYSGRPNEKTGIASI